MATAFMAHPYHHSTIGWKSDIENVRFPKFLLDVREKCIRKKLEVYTEVYRVRGGNFVDS